MKKTTIFWGLFFILSAAFVILSQLGIIGQFNFWTLLLSVFLLAIIIQSIIHVEFFGILMPLAVIAILYADQLGIRAITPWPVLGAAFLGSIGFDIIFKDYVCKKYRARFGHHLCGGVHDFNGGEHQEDIDNDNVNCQVSFAASVKYLHTKNLTSGVFSCSFGSLKVFFDQSELNPNGAVITVDNSFSGMELYIPANWNTTVNIATSMGGVSTKGMPRMDRSLPPLTIKGNCSFGGVDIYYV